MKSLPKSNDIALLSNLDYVEIPPFSPWIKKMIAN